MPILKIILSHAKHQLSHLENGGLDAEVLLAHLLKVDRSYLYTWPEREISQAQIDTYDHWISQRALGYPVAYLTGEKEFFGITLSVTPATLIPRPETELLVEEALARLSPAPLAILELGTGSGAISIALATHRPSWKITATDHCPEALAIAKKNGITYHLNNIEWKESHWYQNLSLTQKYTAIISNPPYLAGDRLELQGELRYEPAMALVALEQGTADLKTIIQGAARWLEPQGLLMLEHGYNQRLQVKQCMEACGFYVTSLCDLGGLDRVSIGKLC